MTEKEYTKVVNRKCQDCGKPLSILCNESAQIVAVRCPECFQTFRINAIEIEWLQAYLSKKGWIEIPIERVTVIKMRTPHPQISVTNFCFYTSKKGFDRLYVCDENCFKYNCYVLREND